MVVLFLKMFFLSLIEDSESLVRVFDYLYCLCNYLKKDNSLFFFRILFSFNSNLIVLGVNGILGKLG